jgi:hypothetical protein
MPATPSEAAQPTPTKRRKFGTCSLPRPDYVCCPSTSPNNSVAYVTAKVSVPAANIGGPILLAASSITPLIGDPAMLNYDQRIPNFEAPLVVTLGIVDGPLRGPPNGVVSFPVQVSDYMRGGKMECVFL